MRKGSMIEGIFLDIANSKEVDTLEMFYSKKNYGGAETYALRKIVPVWVKLINSPTGQEVLKEKVRLGVLKSTPFIKTGEGNYVRQ